MGAQKMMFLDHLIGLQTKQNKSLEEEISGLHEILTAQSKVLSTADRPIVARVLNSVSAASASPMSRASSPATTAMCESPMAMETSVQMAPLPATSSSSSLSFPPSSVAAQNLFAPPSLATNAAVAAAAAAAVLPRLRRDTHTSRCPRLGRPLFGTRRSRRWGWCVSARKTRRLISSLRLLLPWKLRPLCPTLVMHTSLSSKALNLPRIGPCKFER